MKRSIDWGEFLRNGAGKESSDRLLLLLSFPFATGLALWIGNTESLGVYLAAYGGIAINNKWVDRGRDATTHETLETSGGGDTGAVADDSGPDGGGVSGQGKPAGAGKRRAY